MVVVGENQAVIFDTFVPLDPASDIVNVKGALATILRGRGQGAGGRGLVGLMVTGFDADHFNEIGLNIVLNKYRPDWIMYSTYFKKTANATRCSGIVDRFVAQTGSDKVSVRLSENRNRLYAKRSTDFTFEIFSPHADDMNSSNNCSLVCKITERSSGATYLVTGDTEGDRWDSIAHYFSRSLRADVLAAPHHGSRNGITRTALNHIDPHTVILSAGVDNQYGHPDREAVTLFERHGDTVYATNDGDGQSLQTTVLRSGVSTVLFEG